MDVWLAAVERQRTKLASATFRIQTLSAFAKTDLYRDGTASTKVLIKPYPQGPTQTLAYRRICQKVRGSNPFGRTQVAAPGIGALKISALKIGAPEVVRVSIAHIAG
jgi:hypothetical protein